MSGKRLIAGFLVFLALFAAALIYAQFFAYYVRVRDLATLTIDGASLPIGAYDGIDASSSPLKLRGCFLVNPALLQPLPPVKDATPLNPPFWFHCFDTGRLTRDSASGAALAYAVSRDQPKGFDTMIAVYPDGHGYLWRQLGASLAD